MSSADCSARVALPANLVLVARPGSIGDLLLDLGVHEHG
jgi:hypothetical protein